jgi:HEAT repeat protein
VEGGRLTVSALGVPLQEVLHAVGRAAGLRVHLAGDLGAPVTQSFSDLPLDVGLRRLGRGHSLTFVYARDAGPGPAVLAAVSVYPEARRRATGAAELRTIARLAGRRDAAAVATLARLTAHADPLVRSRAATGLGGLGGGRAVSALQAALKDPVAAVRCHAVTALHRVQGEAAAGALGDVLRGDTHPAVRRTAARALGSLQGAAARGALEAAREDPDPAVRQEVLQALAGGPPPS